MPTLGLGTVQFGIPYGITNIRGQVEKDEVRLILQEATRVGLRYLDTAQSYGRSEEILGQNLDPDHSFRVVTKTLPLKKKCIGLSDILEVREAFLKSLKRLRQPSVEILLVHHAEDLMAEGSEKLWVMLESLRDEGFCKKIGTSLYDPVELTFLLARFPLQVIQIPLNLLDQRFLEHLDRVNERGIEVHARSLFLQGLLLAETGKLNSYFNPLFPFLERIRKFCRDSQISPMTLALSMMKGLKVDVALVGVSSLVEMKEILAGWDVAGHLEPILRSTFACPIKEMINPALWPPLSPMI